MQTWQIVGRRDLGRKLVFLTVCRVGGGPQEALSDDESESESEDEGGGRAAQPWVVWDNDNSIEVCVEKTRYIDQDNFRFDTNLMRLGCHFTFEGFPGTSLKTGEPMVYVASSSLERARPHPTFIFSLMELVRQSKVTREQFAGWLGGVSEEFTTRLMSIDKGRLRPKISGVSRLMQGRPEQRSRERASRISKEALKVCHDNDPGFGGCVACGLWFRVDLAP